MFDAAASPPPPAPEPARAMLPRDGQVGGSAWVELAATAADVGRLLRRLVADPRVPLRTKVMVGAAAMYVAVPVSPLPDVIPGTGIGPDDLLAVMWAVRRLVADAGYEVVRELWAGSDAGFVWLMLLTGVDR